ncbi:hypothetical protein [Streptomyces griseoluteus]|uniref:hypothetical protein n=1 Tax=Streptomyces griseoluteus TaxID=29306 RepID=UPI00370250BE
MISTSESRRCGRPQDAEDVLRHARSERVPVVSPIASAAGTSRTLAGCAALVVLATAAALLAPQPRSLRTAAEVRVVEPEAARTG